MESINHFIVVRGDQNGQDFKKEGTKKEGKNKVKLNPDFVMNPRSDVTNIENTT